MKALKQWLDRRAIRLATRMLPEARRDLPRDEEALRLLGEPGFLRPPAVAARPAFGREGAFRCPSAVASGTAAADTIHGRFFERPGAKGTVILVHGWNAELHYLYGFPRLARRLNERGLNAAMFELPYHLQRRPRRPAEMRDFISEHLAGMLRATRQAVADIESLARWAQERDGGPVGVWGFSLGAWLAGLHAAHSDTVRAVALKTPVSDLKLAVETLPFCFPIRAALERTPAELGRLNLTAHRPQIARGNILVTEGAYDQFVPAETYAALAAAWELPGWETVAQSHLSILLSRRGMGRTADWLAAHLPAGGS